MPQVRSAGLALHLLGVKLVPGRRQATTHDRWAAGSARFVFQILRLFQVFTRLEMPQVRSAGLALHLLGQIGARPSAGNNPRSMGRRLGVDGPLTPHAEKMQRSFAALRMTAGPKCRTMLAPLERPQGLRGEPCATETQPIIVTQHEKPRTLKTEVRANLLPHKDVIFEQGPAENLCEGAGGYHSRHRSAHRRGTPRGCTISGP